MQFRSYQSEAVETAFAQWSSGTRATLFVCPTGGGKTLTFAEIVRKHLLFGGRRALVIADREWLVSQAAGVLASHVTSSKVGIEMAKSRANRAALPSIVCASIQSLVRRLEAFDKNAFDLIVIDEADLALAPSYRRVVDHFADAKIFGCTATPDRGDGVALGLLFDATCGDVDIRDLIDAGYLCPVRQHTVKVLDLSRVKMSGDDFDEKSLERILVEERHLHEVVKPTMELAGDRPTLVFATSVTHAEKLAAVFNRYRPGSARAVSGKTQRKNRRQIVRAFVAREFQFLCNCNLIMRGVDVPEIACVAMARPTQSRTVYVQGIGRGTRPTTGKDDLLVLDFTDGATTFSLVNAVDVLGGRATAEERERAHEIVEEEPGADVSLALDRARAELAADAKLRERVRAKVKFKTREVAVHEPIDWGAQPLGQVTDKALAKMLGVSPGAVRQQRIRRNILRFSKFDGINWDEQPLGVERDLELAKRLGVSRTTVGQQRTLRGIAPVPGSGVPRHTDWEGAGLGTVSDHVIAKRLNVAASAVKKARDVRGIAPCPTSSRKRKDIDWDIQPFGERNDAEIARALNCDTAAVQIERTKRGIAAVPHAYAIDWSKQPLGKRLDRVLALELGVSASLVAMKRKERGIPPFRK